MKDPRVCVKHLFEETTNVARYSWFERSNLIAYEPGMRRRVANKHPIWKQRGNLMSGNCFADSNCTVTPHESSIVKDEDSSAKDKAGEGLSSGDQEIDTDGDYDVTDNTASGHLPNVLVEHRWSFLFRQSSVQPAPFLAQSPRTWFHETTHQDAPYKTVDGNDGKESRTEHNDDCNPEHSCDDSGGTANPRVTSVKEAFGSAEFGGRSSVLRCLIMNLETRYISRTQMNYLFHLSAIAERVVQEGVFYLVNTSNVWNPVICNEPVDVECAVRLAQLLKQVVAECNINRGTFGYHGESKYQKVSDSMSVATGHSKDISLEMCNGATVGSDAISKASFDPYVCPTMDLRFVSSGTAVLDHLPHKTAKDMIKSLTSLSSSCSSTVPKAEVSSKGMEGEDVNNQLLSLLRDLCGEGSTDTLICSTIVSLIRAMDSPISAASRVNVEDVPTQDVYEFGSPNRISIDSKLHSLEYNSYLIRRERLCDYTQGFLNPRTAVERYCLCCSKYALCPTVLNEFIMFGGSPATPSDMELGIWIFDSPYTRLKMRDVPVVYHQQVQYSTKKYITIADLNDAILSARVLNLRMEFCGRGDWIFDDGSLPYFEGEKERPLYGKVITADDLMQLEFTGTVNQIAKKFFLLQKAFLTTGKEGTSRLVFMDPYANIDATICDEKETIDLLTEILTTMYNMAPDSFLASSNGYYYHEDGFLPEGIEIQRLRNQLFNLEASHYRTAMLADIINDQKMMLNLSHKMPFLTKCKRVVIGKSRIHGYGLFAVDTINKGDLILEYAGVVISDYMADIREAMYEKMLCGSIYMFRLDLNHIIDSTFYGNCARFINHSCDPNTATTNFSYIDEDGFGTHVGIYASKVIPAGEEIYYNYRLSSGAANKEVCYCGSYMCTGYMSLVK